MGRRHPPRAGRTAHPGLPVPGLPRSTSAALDALGLTEQVRHGLLAWDYYTRIPSGPRRWEKDPSDEDVGGTARRFLDDAIAALPEREARPLRRAVARMDRRFLDATVPDPSVPADRPWWQRQDWF